jgi:hypothetical protein
MFGTWGRPTRRNKNDCAQGASPDERSTTDVNLALRHDSTDPPSVAKADYDYYQANCGCDVTQWIVPNTAHLFMVHTSLPSWIDYVSKWLTSRGIAPLKIK